MHTLKVTGRQMGLLLLVGAGGALASSCFYVYVFVALLASYFFPYQQTEYDLVPGVPYYADDGSGPAAATIKMWWQFYTGGSGSESDISTYLSGIGSSGSGYPGVSPDQFASALQNYTGVGTLQYYDGTCNGQSCANQALADIHTALYNNRPPAIIWGDYSIISGAGTDYDCRGIYGCNPTANFLTINVPVPGYGEEYEVSNDYFISRLQADDAAKNVFFGNSGDPMAVDSDGWAAWAGYGGTYYGNPDPPDEVCPDFADYCQGSGGGSGPPSFGPLQGPASSGGSRAKFWTANHVAVPNPRTRDEIIADFIAGLEATHIDLRPGMAPLRMDDGSIQVQGQMKVRSLVAGIPDYFLLSFVEGSTHQLYARAALSSAGLLMSVALADGQVPLRVVGSIEDARRALIKNGIESTSGAEAVFDVGPGSLPELDPSFLAIDATGRAAIVTADGVVHDYSVPAPPTAPVGRVARR